MKILPPLDLLLFKVGHDGRKPKTQIESGIFNLEFSTFFAKKCLRHQKIEKTKLWVARAMKNENLCSSSVSEDTCLSTELISEEECGHVLSTKESVVDGTRDTLCSTECADTCGPLPVCDQLLCSERRIVQRDFRRG